MNEELMDWPQGEEDGVFFYSKRAYSKLPVYDEHEILLKKQSLRRM
jgi:hypothetical protein